MPEAQSTLFGLPTPTSGAVLSECGGYRYNLWRTWGELAKGLEYAS